MKLNTFEAFGVAISIGAMALALWFLRLETTTTNLTAVVPEDQAATVVVSTEGNQDAALANAVIDGSDYAGRLEKLIIDDVVFGEGEEAEAGDALTVHYIGTLRNGQQFDNSYLKGEPFTFTLGEGRVIQGWDVGMEGMKVGGQRVLVIPPEYGYGDAGAGPIPGGATLVFAIELLSIE